MITGLYISQHSVVSEEGLKSSLNGEVIDFAILRARVGGRDDSKITQHRKLMETVSTSHGSILWGADFYLAYAEAPTSRKQVEDFWNLINQGGRTWSLPPEIDLEWQPKDWDPVAKKYKSFYPVPKDFLTSWVEPAVKYLQDRYGRAPTIYSAPSFIQDYLTQNGVVPDWLKMCNLHIAHYGVISPKFTGWDYWTFWQSTNTTTWNSITGICIERFNGTRQDLKKFCSDSSWKPGDHPTPEPEPKPEPPAGNPWDEILTRLERMEKILESLKWLGK